MVLAPAQDAEGADDVGVDGGLGGVEQLRCAEHPGEVDDGVGALERGQAAEDVVAVGSVERPRLMAFGFGGSDGGLSKETGPAGNCDLHAVPLICAPTFGAA